MTCDALAPPLRKRQRPSVAGKFIYLGGRKFYAKGVTYGTFEPSLDGCQFPEKSRVNEDFRRMSSAGINSVRTYTPPPLWLLDLALKNGLLVMVGLPWEQHIDFLRERGQAEGILRRVRAEVHNLAGHPAILCFTVGNEIPASVVRWIGKLRVERFIEQLYATVKAVDPGALVAYVNFPTTEYLELPFLDLFCFNVYLEERQRLSDYLARLHNLAGDRPLIMAEIGLDSRKNGTECQASTLHWQIKTVFDSGAAGAFVFAWTDEWYRGGYDIEDWDFGLVDRERRPKAALEAVSGAYQQAPFGDKRDRPRISVVVCTYNGRRTLEELFNGLRRLQYPNFEVIVVSDGSSDGSVALAYGQGFDRVIAGPNRGLSAARNIGLHAASGELVAYIDDDAIPDPHWLHYLAYTFETTDHAAVGGPNIQPVDDPWVPQCVAQAPGNASHVLISDAVAEHIPGCNMAFRREALLEIGGFDSRFTIAGDDVDVCWRVQQKGWTIGYHPAAMVWHHRRETVNGYLKQQRNYGAAEAMLESKWPEKYNRAGHTKWEGRIYGSGHTLPIGGLRSHVYQGVWGSAAFQAVYPASPGLLSCLPLLSEWYVVNLALFLLGFLGFHWYPLFGAWAALLVTVGLPVRQAVDAGVQAQLPTGLQRGFTALRSRVLIATLHMLQPAARLVGRLRWGLSPWRWQVGLPFVMPWNRELTVWFEQWNTGDERLSTIHHHLTEQGLRVVIGDEYAPWDLETLAGLMGSARLASMTEEHGAGRQLTRLRLKPRASWGSLIVISVVSCLALIAWTSSAMEAAGILALIAVLLAARTVAEMGCALGATMSAVHCLTLGEHPPDRVEAPALEVARDS